MTWGYTVFKAAPMCDWQSHCTMNAHSNGRAGKCAKPTGYVTRYFYVTGRKGRTSSNDRWVCKDHAERFAAKHRVEILEQPPEAGRIGDRARALIHSLHQEPKP